MKFTFLFFALGLFASSAMASTNCYPPKLARDAIRAIALISDRSMITDLVGSSTSVIDDQATYRIWANYRNHGERGYSDEYEVVVGMKGCRIVSFQLKGEKLPVKEAENNVGSF